MNYVDLIKKLRSRRVCLQTGLHLDTDYPLLLEAADAIEELQKDLERSKEYETFWEKEATEALKKFQVAVASKHRWVPVSERLPDTMKDKSAYSGWSAEIAPSDDVLCYLGSANRQTVAWYSHTYEEWTTVDENTVYEYGEVTHWMPLPTPPEEE